MFTMSSALRGGDSRELDALFYCIKHGVDISGEVAEWLVNEDFYVIDSGYVDFEDASRWSISKYYILKIDGEYFRIWQEVGLTEMQSNEWYDQRPERVEHRAIKAMEWVIPDEVVEDSVKESRTNVSICSN